MRQTIQELSTLGFDVPRLTLAWIKAHLGYEGNELANQAAKQGALEPHMSIKTDIPISKTEIANTLKEQIYNKWILKWVTSTDYKHSKKFLNKPDSNRGTPAPKTENEKTCGNYNRTQQPKLLPIQSRPRC